MLHEPIAHATHELRAERRVINSFVLVKSASDEKEEIWVRSVLLLFCCAVRGEEREQRSGTCTVYI